MSDNQKVSLTADELKALDLVISVAQSQGVSPDETLSFISSIAHALTSAVSSVTKVAHAVAPVVQAVVPVIQAVAPIVAAIAGGAAMAQQQPPQSTQFDPQNLTLQNLMELRRRADQP
jgi:hypothetical protein